MSDLPNETHLLCAKLQNAGWRNEEIAAELAVEVSAVKRFFARHSRATPAQLRKLRALVAVARAGPHPKSA